MKHSNPATADTSKNDTPKTALDGFKLFYEELPLELENRIIKTDKRSKDRLQRKSRARY